MQGVGRLIFHDFFFVITFLFIFNIATAAGCPRCARQATGGRNLLYHDAFPPEKASGSKARYRL